MVDTKTFSAILQALLDMPEPKSRAALAHLRHLARQKEDRRPDVETDALSWDVHITT